VNVSAGLELCNGDRDLYCDVLRMVYEVSPKQLTELADLWEKKDYQNYVVQIHSMKAQLLHIGYEHLAEKARALEMAGRESRFEYIEEHMDDFMDSYKEFLKQLHTWNNAGI